VTVFGGDTVMVRIRSSSNAEDTPTFNGAGLYDSTSACAADSLAGAGPGASACDPSKEHRTLERGLAQVWSSLWNYGAFEEREYYQLDHAAIAMGATISLRYEDERINGVAFTGNPVDPQQARFTVNAQLGEVDVVNPTPGVTAELSLLTLADGEVVEIERIVPSTLVTSGQTVMSDAQLEQLGRVMAELEASYPVDYEAEGTASPILDLEFKITDHDELVIKQIRTFLPTAYASDPTCR
jgi:pyruvate, water dikinase